MKMEMWAERASHLEMGTVLDIARDVTHGCNLGTLGTVVKPLRLGVGWWERGS